MTPHIDRLALMALAAFALSLPARAEETASADTVVFSERSDPALDRLTGMAEVGLGWLVLPAAQVCVERDIAGCTRGDSSLELDAWQLFRGDRRFAVGAGMTLGLTPTTDAPRQDPPGTNRDHSRGYFTFEGMLRYYPVVNPPFEAWAGLTGGLVVVSDRFESNEGRDDKALVGPRGVTIRTEGYTVGLALGGAYSFATSWSLGATLRYGSWFLPGEPARDPLGDEASLTGQNDVLSLVLAVGYRVPL